MQRLGYPVPVVHPTDSTVRTASVSCSERLSNSAGFAAGGSSAISSSYGASYSPFGG